MYRIFQMLHVITVENKMVADHLKDLIYAINYKKKKEKEQIGM